jgi:hypothetical protein
LVHTFSCALANAGLGDSHRIVVNPSMEDPYRRGPCDLDPMDRVVVVDRTSGKHIVWMFLHTWNNAKYGADLLARGAQNEIRKTSEKMRHSYRIVQISDNEARLEPV